MIATNKEARLTCCIEYLRSPGNHGLACDGIKVQVGIYPAAVRMDLKAQGRDTTAMTDDDCVAEYISEKARVRTL